MSSIAHCLSLRCRRRSLRTGCTRARDGGIVAPWFSFAVRGSPQRCSGSPRCRLPCFCRACGLSWGGWLSVHVGDRCGVGLIDGSPLTEKGPAGAGQGIYQGFRLYPRVGTRMPIRSEPARYWLEPPLRPLPLAPGACPILPGRIGQQQPYAPPARKYLPPQGLRSTPIRYPALYC